MLIYGRSGLIITQNFMHVNGRFSLPGNHQIKVMIEHGQIITHKVNVRV